MKDHIAHTILSRKHVAGGTVIIDYKPDFVLESREVWYQHRKNR